MCDNQHTRSDKPRPHTGQVPRREDVFCDWVSQKDALPDVEGIMPVVREQERVVDAARGQRKPAGHLRYSRTQNSQLASCSSLGKVGSKQAPETRKGRQCNVDFTVSKLLESNTEEDHGFGR